MIELEQKIGYRFSKGELLETALTHSSYANEELKDGLGSYERLEFLGDSILGFASAELLYLTQPERHEGELTRLRAELVCEKSLAAVAEELELGKYLRLSHGEAASGGNSRTSIIADLVEAVIAAIYLDGGMEEAKKFIRRFVLADTQRHMAMNVDYKTRLQELVQRKKDQLLEYRLLSESGPDHDKHFEVEVLLNGNPVGTGAGSSKKRAEQEAAEQAIGRLFPTKE